MNLSKNGDAHSNPRAHKSPVKISEGIFSKNIQHHEDHTCVRVQDQGPRVEVRFCSRQIQTSALHLAPGRLHLLVASIRLVLEPLAVSSVLPRHHEDLHGVGVQHDFSRRHAVQPEPLSGV